MCCKNLISSVTSSIKQNAKLSLSNKTITYTNSKMKVQGTLTGDAFKIVLDFAKSDGGVISITGEDRLQFRVL